MKHPISFFALASLFLCIALFTLPENIRAVDSVTLIASGVAIGALVTTGIRQLRQQ